MERRSRVNEHVKGIMFGSSQLILSYVYVPNFLQQACITLKNEEKLNYK